MGTDEERSPRFDAERLVREREARGWTQGELSEKAEGVHRHTIRSYESAEINEPRFDLPGARQTIEKLAGALGLAWEELVAFSDEAPSSEGLPSAGVDDRGHALDAVVELRTLGPEHPDTLHTQGNLVNTLSALGRYDEALSLHQQTLEALGRTLGPEHPDTLRAQGSLANTLSALGRHDEALELRRRVLEVQTRTLGPEHPSTLRARGNLADVLRTLGRAQRALAIEREVSAAFARVLGEDPPRTLWVRANQAESLRALGQGQEARQLCAEVLEARTRVLGVGHPHTRWTQRFLDEIDGGA